MIRLTKSISFLFLAALICPAARVPASQTAETKSSSSSKRVHNSITQDDRNWMWHQIDDGIDIDVRIQGKVEFTDDYSDIKSVEDGGWITVKESRGGVTRKFEARMAADGLKRSYSVNGQASPLDDEGRAWLAKMLIETVRQGGYDAKERVERILKRGGPRAVLAEISQLKGDYVKRVYFEELLNQSTLDNETAREVLNQAGREIRSDYEKTQLLIKMSGSYLRDEPSRTIYLGAVSTIRSDYEKGRALSALLKQGNLSKDNLLFAIKAAHTISSDYERAQLLIKIADGFQLDDDQRAAYLSGIAPMKSDYEKGRVLSALLKKGDSGKETLLFTVKSALTISSDYEKAQLLLKVAAVGSGDESVRNALVESARTIKSEYERGRVLSAVYK
ncbi:MAG TPA: hypothetical protein VJZ26_18570 [Blastocatellia bacterium]|nr:hypothetical protein [Blastocatellia bacterium]